MNGNQPPGGLLELPGMKGTIEIHYDLRTGAVELKTGAHPIPFPALVRMLLLLAQEVVGNWEQIDTRIIRQKGTPADGNQEKGDP